MKFDKSFIFGVATAAYQIEGAFNEDGRTASIWDTFSKTEGKVYNMENGDIACDHYHRYKEDVKIIKELGADCYRLSISWPRIFPEHGRYNPSGMAFYKELLTELKQNGIKTAVTLYHWDLPQWAQSIGGWEARESADWFLSFARQCFTELDDLVDMWITHNEPWCAAILSNAMGVHAPGKKNIAAALKVGHHILLSHGMAVRLYRELHLKKPIGITLNLTPAYAAGNSFADILAASNHDGTSNRWFLEPLFKGSYPFDIANLYAARVGNFDFIKEGDFDVITEKCDFLGINYYTRSLVEFDPMSLTLTSGACSSSPKTDMGWDITPESLIDMVKIVRERYTSLPVYITENGSAWPDIPEDGCIHDKNRIDYLDSHLKAVAKMNEMGLNIAGYFCWSLMDNFEWSFGYSKRFGIVYVDYETQARIKKDSFYRYRQIIQERKL
ncbi:MAG TPA: GH1 family beta-glucosidase [Clostridia bacterium]|nr:GH1 family beta-glucosidase [Clostridia bacterium]